jgi:hypothetical protein
LTPRAVCQDPCALNPPNGRDTDPVNAEMAISAVRDITQLLPELAPLCAPARDPEMQPTEAIAAAP